MRLQKQKLFQAVYGFSLILGFCHHLVPQIGVLHLRDIGVTIQNSRSAYQEDKSISMESLPLMKEDEPDWSFSIS